MYVNKSNGKIYVGQSNNPKRRHIEHKYQKHNSYIDNAIKKYGIDNFEFKIIEEWETVEEANRAEIAAIKYYNSIAPSGYNIEHGGKNMPKNPESIRKMVRTRKETGCVRGAKNPSAKITQEVADQIRDLYNKTTMTQHQLASKFGISRSCVRDILINKTWK